MQTHLTSNYQILDFTADSTSTS